MKTDDRSRAIGKIISVAADRFTVELHKGSDNFTVNGFDDIHYVARIGSYIIIPVRADYVVAEVVQLREKDSGGSFAGRSASELDKAGSANYLDVVPVGMLPQDRQDSFRFGVSAFPSLYEDALYALDEELDRIFDVAHAEEIIPAGHGGDGQETRLKVLTIGESVVFPGYKIKARINELFGGHAAILGNTGSGKSCTVASIIQSLFSKTSERPARGASFVVLDVNGEYRQAFSELPAGIRKLYWQVLDDHTETPPKLEKDDPNEVAESFRLPHWFMSQDEWELLLHASERTQQPVLRTALGITSLFAGGGVGEDVRNHIVAKCVRQCFETGDPPVATGNRVVSILKRFGTAKLNIDLLKKSGFDWKYNSFGEAGPAKFFEALDALLLPSMQMPKYNNAPFKFEELEQAIDLALLYEEAYGNRQIRDHCAPMLTRLRSVIDREEFSFLRVETAELRAHEGSVSAYVDRIVGVSLEADSTYRKSTQLTTIDLNSAADDVVQLAAAVLARLVFERLRRADPRNRLPVNFILEEAHRYIAEQPTILAKNASRIFERISKEGRKYGVLLSLASQRPSELSRTVLSQCSNFIVHRIQNPEDLSHIRSMTPFISESVLRRLPSLPRQHALVFGNAVNLPTTFKVRNVFPKPRSDDANMEELLFLRADAPIAISWRAAPQPKSDDEGPVTEIDGSALDLSTYQEGEIVPTNCGGREQ